MQIFDQIPTLMIINFSFFYNSLDATAPTLMHVCLICTFAIYLLRNSERHRMDDEKIPTTATFHVLNFSVVGRKTINTLLTYLECRK